MKRAKLFRMLATCVVLSLLVALVPASSALAAREIDLEKDEGEIGEYIDITGENWPPSDPGADPPFYRYLDIYFTSDEAGIGDDMTEEVTVYELVEEEVQVDTDGE